MSECSNRPKFLLMYRSQLTGSLKLGLGDAVFDHMPPEAAILRYDGKDVLKVGYRRDEVFGGSRPSISGAVCNEGGNELIRFADNELTIIDNRVDVTLKGTTLRIFDHPRKLVLEITFHPPDGIRIDRLRFRYGDIVCEMDRTFGLTVPTRGGRWARYLVSGIRASGAHAAIDYVSDQAKWHSGDSALTLAGGEGIWISDTGATLAYKAGVMFLPRLQVAHA
jgi:hypothetical protein